jgi:hypothetical protein
MSWAVAAGAVSEVHQHDENDEGHTTGREDELLLDDLLE